MSTLWTPDGERPVRRSNEDQAPPASSPTSLPSAPPPGASAGGEPSDAELQAHMEQLRQQLLDAPAEIVIANHAFGLFELAALHLSQQPPKLEQSRLAIDALGVLVEGLAGRLGEPEEQLADGLAQLRMAFVQINAASRSEAQTEGSAPTQE